MLSPEELVEVSPADATAPKATIIMPAHNEAATIAATLRKLRRLYPDYEILVVDDGSTDNTGQLSEAAGVRVVRNQINRGYGAALKRGMRQASGDIVVFIDGDGQHSPEDIARLVKCLENCDMAVGQRSQGDQVSIRKPGKWLLQRVAEFLVGRNIPDINSGLRALYRKDGLRFLPILPNGFSLTTTITLAMMKEGMEVEYIPIRVAPRGGGKSRVSYLGDGMKTLLLISRVTMLFNPLKVFAPVSALLLSVGAAYTLFYLVVARNISDASILLTLSGLGMLFFGLLADQVSNLRRGG